MKWNRSVLTSIPVSGGTGVLLVPTTVHSTLNKICIQVPNHNSNITYDVDITDADGFGISGKGNLAGDSTFNDDSPCTGPLRLTISSASSDGSYSVKIYFVENLMG